MARLTVAGLSLRFGGLAVLDDVSFAVDAGALFAVIGPNGAGKTSLLNCINGVYRPDAGHIELAGTPLTGLRPHRIAAAGVARVFQAAGLFSGLTVIDSLMLGRHHLMRGGVVAGGVWFGRARREELAHRRFAEVVVDLLELEPVRHEPTRLLPYGLQKRVELGRARCMQPRLLLLDEPVAGLNTEETEDMARFLLEAKDLLGLTVVLVEHDMGLVMDISDEVLVLDFGTVVTAGPPAQVQRDPHVVAAYLGEPTADATTGIE